MHRCLQIPEIVDLICDLISDDTIPSSDDPTEAEAGLLVDPEIDVTNYMNPDNYGHWFIVVHKRTSQLIALAQTCRHLQQPALQRLWGSLDSIVPIFASAAVDLLKYPSRQLLTRRDRMFGPASLELTRPITPSEAGTMKKYGSFVRNFSISMYYPPSEAIDAWIALRDTFTGTTLFPNLRSITWSDELIDFITLFGTQKLTSLNLITPVSLSPSLANFASACPSLITASGVNPETILAFSHCSNLRTIGFDVDDVDNSQWPFLGTECDFPRLEAISIDQIQAPHATRFLDALPSTANINSVDVDIIEDENGCIASERDYLHILQSLVKYSHSLKRIWIRYGINTTPSTPGTILTSTLLSKLATYFIALTEVMIFHTGHYHFTDEDVNALTEALPLLETFSLTTSDEGELSKYTHKVTIMCLMYFARNCPNISSLGIAFDAETEPIPHYPESPFHPNLRLRTLDVANSSATSHRADEVANFIIRTFPHIQEMYWNEVNDPHESWLDCTRAWSKVSRILKQRIVAW